MKKAKLVKSYGTVVNEVPIDGDPFGLTATADTDGIILEWTNGSTNEDKILIERSVDGTDFYGIATVAVDVETYLDSMYNLNSADGDYWYRVSAMRKHSQSRQSNTPELVHLLSNNVELDYIFLAVTGSEYIIDLEAKTVAIMVPFGTDVTELVATFTASPLVTSVKIGLVAQESGVTANDFTSAVTYAIIAQDETTTISWVVTVYIESE